MSDSYTSSKCHPTLSYFLSSNNLETKNYKSYESLKCSKIETSFWKRNEWAITIENVYSSEECLALIEYAQQLNFVRPANEKLRNNERAMVDSFPISMDIYHRIQKYIPKVWKNRRRTAINERLRFLRYQKNDEFLPHFDDEYRRINGERSYFTLILYLNSNFNGGQTSFIDICDGNKKKMIEPQTGMCLIFQHQRLLHCGEKLLSSVYSFESKSDYSIKDDEVVYKYCIRSDVMFEKHSNFSLK